MVRRWMTPSAAPSSLGLFNGECAFSHQGIYSGESLAERQPVATIRIPGNTVSLARKQQLSVSGRYIVNCGDMPAETPISRVFFAGKTLLRFQRSRTVAKEEKS
ncbi:hypothetical protein TNCV_2098171 [Trichonephila clavipes]|nr:hypothetical protein TNCV_2098171 [Trichonephila clavipes]